MVSRSRLKRTGKKKRGTRLPREKHVFIPSYASAESMGIKPIDSIIGKVVNPRTKEIVGFTESSTFGTDLEEAGWKFAPNLKTYKFPHDHEFMAIQVHATDVETAKKALGFGSSYEEEWGDYAPILKKLKEGTQEIYETERTWKRVD